MYNAPIIITVRMYQHKHNLLNYIYFPNVVSDRMSITNCTQKIRMILDTYRCI